MRALPAVLVLLLGACVQAPPTDVAVRTYEVSGTTLSSLERSLSIHGPAVPGVPGRAFAAVETQFVHSFEPHAAGGRCRYRRNGKVGLRSEVILPKWRHRDSAARDLQDKWDVISRYAVIHEAGHIEISQKYARILEGAFKRASARTCEALNTQMEAEAERILIRHTAEQRRFDRTDRPRFERYLHGLGYTT